MGTIVNFGTSQSGVKDIVLNKNNTSKLSEVFYSTISLRLIIFLVFLLIFSLLEFVHIQNYYFYFFAIPLIFSEVLNPMFLFLGKEKLAIFNLTNLVSKILTILAILIFIQGKQDSIWINFIIGSLNCFAYLFLLIWGISNYKLSYKRPQKSITQINYPFIKLIVRESDAEEYLKNGNDIEIVPDSAQGNLCRIRNYIFRGFFEY
jgi:hypothetical protein